MMINVGDIAAPTKSTFAIRISINGYFDVICFEK
jgi:hypothetical protein